MIKVARNHAFLKKLEKQEDNYMKASFAQRVSFVWELTQEIWMLKDKKSVQRRLQRHIATLVKK